MNIGLIGLGKIVALGHMPSYVEAGLPVVAAADLSEAAASSFAETFDVAAVGTDIDAVLNDPAVEVVDIATPPSTHPELVKRAVDAGKHVMCQKPLAMTLAEAEEMVEYAAERGVSLAVNQNVRYSPSNMSVAEWVHGGVVGPVHDAKLEYHSTMAYDPWRAKLPHMVFTDMLVHYIDLMRWWFGSPDRIFAAETLSATSSDGAATIGTLTAVYETGPVVNLICDWVNVAGEPSYVGRVGGASGTIQFAGSNAAQYRLEGAEWVSGPVVDPTLWKPGIGFLPAFAACMQGFIDAVAKGEEPPTSARDNLRTLDILFAAHRSIETGEAQRIQPRGDA